MGTTNLPKEKVNALLLMGMSLSIEGILINTHQSMDTVV
jgi:hypothetical protein